MEEGKKKLVMIIVVVVCLVAAGIITYSTRSGGGGIESIKRGAESVWLKCRNPNCEHTWQMDKRAYYEYIKDNMPPGTLTAPGVVCPECGEESGYRAIKCPNCGFIFEKGSVPNDLSDRCPKCGYSAIEKRAEKARKNK